MIGGDRFRTPRRASESPSKGVAVRLDAETPITAVALSAFVRVIRGCSLHLPLPLSLPLRGRCARGECDGCRRSAAADNLCLVPTQSERKALLFFAAVALLGAGWRVVRAANAPDPAAEERAALAAQIAAVDSVRARRHGRARGASLARTRPPPAGRAKPVAPAAPPAPVNVDEATAAELESLPRIGPALAKRIVEDREANGPFGSLEAFQRVKGIGPAMARTLAPRVTFSTSRRPNDASMYRPITRPPVWPAAHPAKLRC